MESSDADQERIEKELDEHYAREKEFAAAIGTFVMHFVRLETHVNAVMCTFLRIPREGLSELLVAAIRNVSTRLHILESLVNGVEMPTDLRAELRSRIKEVRDLNTDRNWLLHTRQGVYLPQEDAWQRISAQTRDRFKRKVKHFSIADVQAKTEQCWKASNAFLELTASYVAYRDEKDRRKASDRPLG